MQGTQTGSITTLMCLMSRSHYPATVSRLVFIFEVGPYRLWLTSPLGHTKTIKVTGSKFTSSVMFFPVCHISCILNPCQLKEVKAYIQTVTITKVCNWVIQLHPFESAFKYLGISLNFGNLYLSQPQIPQKRVFNGNIMVSGSFWYVLSQLLTGYYAGSWTGFGN